MYGFLIFILGLPLILWWITSQAREEQITNMIGPPPKKPEQRSPEEIKERQKLKDELIVKLRWNPDDKDWVDNYYDAMNKLNKMAIEDRAEERYNGAVTARENLREKLIASREEAERKGAAATVATAGALLYFITKDD